MLGNRQFGRKKGVSSSNSRRQSFFCFAWNGSKYELIPEFEFLAFQMFSDQTSGLDYHKTTTKIYILATDSVSFFFLFSPSLLPSRVWMRIFPALRFLFAELNVCHVSQWARSSAQGLQQVLHVINFPGFIKCLIFVTEEEEGLPWPLGPWL